MTCNPSCIVSCAINDMGPVGHSVTSRLAEKEAHCWRHVPRPAFYRVFSIFKQKDQCVGKAYPQLLHCESNVTTDPVTCSEPL